MFPKTNIKFLLHPDGTNELLEDMHVEWNGCRVTVPMGFQCDGSTIPRFFWRVCGGPRLHENLLAGTFHDFLYANHLYSRKNCDELFYRALRSLGKPWIIAKLMYHAVRIFGKSHY